MIETEEEGKSDCCVDILPPEVLSDILDYLCISDQFVCRSVNCQWRQAIEATSFHDRTRVCLSRDHLKDNETLDSILQVFSADGGHKNYKFSDMALTGSSRFWRTRGAGVSSLELVDCEIGERDLVLLLNSTTSLKRLTLSNCRETLMSGGLMQNQCDVVSVSGSLAGLQTLVLDNNAYLSDVLLLRMVSVSKSLRSLSLSGCNIMNHAGIYAKYYPQTENIEASPSVLTWRTVVKVAGLLSKTLRYLGLSRNSGIDLRLLAEVPDLQLESIDISVCSSVDERAFAQFVEAQPKLRKIKMAGCRRVFSGLSGASKLIFKAMEKVEKLTLNELSIPHFDKIGNMHNIKVLNIDSLDSPGSIIRDGFQQLNVAKLQRLKAKFLAMSPEHLCSILGLGMHSLTYLDISVAGEGVVTDEVVQAICQHLPGLEHLNLAGNPSITDMGTLAIFTSGYKQMEPTVIAAKELFGQLGQISLGSKTEQDIKRISRRQMAVIELLSTRDYLQNDHNRGMPLNRLRKLQYLSLGGASITSLTLSVALESPNLRHLDLSHCDGVDDVGLHDAAAKHPRLEKLELMSSPVTDSGLLYCLSCLPRLHHLDVRRCPALSTQGVASIPHVAPQLTTVLLSHCPGITLETVRAMAADLPFLRRLDTHGLLEAEDVVRFKMCAPPPPPPPPSL